MKLVRFGKKGSEKPALVGSDGVLRDLSDFSSDFSHESISKQVLKKFRKIDENKLPKIPRSVRIGSCLADVPNFYCIGLNYGKHADETGAARPKEPIIFSKASSALSGPFDDVIIPKGSSKTDWEVELGVVIGENCTHVPVEQALSVVAGYCTINDVSEREFQIERGGQWIKGKSAPTFGPIGPYLVTADEIEDPQSLELMLKVNGKIMQKSNTSDMIFSVKEIIAYMTTFMELRVGDIIATGTPEGVGMGMNPQRFLKAGDIIELDVEKLGTQKQKVINF